MITRTLYNIAVMCGGELSSAEDKEIEIAGVVTDSRKITPACLFVPLVGDNFDGHHYAAASLAAGASGILWQRDKGPAPEGGGVILVEDTLTALQKLSSAYLSEIAPRVVAVTGSNGKTATKDMITALLEASITSIRMPVSLRLLRPASIFSSVTP